MPRDPRQDLWDNVILAWLAVPALWFIVVHLCGRFVAKIVAAQQGATSLWGGMDVSLPGAAALFAVNLVYFALCGAMLGQTEQTTGARRAVLVSIPAFVLFYALYWPWFETLHELPDSRRWIVLPLYFFPPVAALFGGEIGGWLYRSERIERRKDRRERERLKKNEPAGINGKDGPPGR